MKASKFSDAQKAFILKQGADGIQCGVGLDKVIDQPTAFQPERAAERRDDASNHPRFEAERIANGDNEVAASQPFRVAKCCRGSAARQLGLAELSTFSNLRVSSGEVPAAASRN